MEKQNNSRTETNQKINITKRTRRSCLKPKPKQALSSSDTSDCEENISDWESENDDTESDDSTSSEESIVDEIEDDFNNVVPNHDTEEDVNEPEEFANSEDQPVSSENPVPRSDTEGATESVLENNFIGKKCNIPSCNSLLPSNKNIFQLPTTGIPVCSDCYKKYLKTEYNRVVDLEETARLTESLSEDLPEIGLEDLTTFFEVVHPGCLTILEDLEKSSKEFLLQKAIDDIFPPMTSESVIWNNLDTYPEYRLYTWTEHETIPFESCSNFLSSFIEDLSKIFPEARISEDSFNHPDFIDDLSSEPSCSPQLNEGIPFNVHKDIESPPNLEIERMFPAENNDEHAVDTEKYLFDHPDFIDGLLSEPSSSPHRCYGADSFNLHRDIETPPILVFEGFFPAENNEDHDVDSEEEQDEASGQELESHKTFSDISSAVQHLWNTYCAPQLTGTDDEEVIEEEDSERDSDEEEEEDEESSNDINRDTTDCFHPLEYNNEPQECDQFSESQEYQYSCDQELDCYQPGSYNSETDWNQEFVPMYEHLETDQFNTSHTLHCYEPPQEDIPIIYSSDSLAKTTLEPVSSIPSSEDPDTQVVHEHIRSCHVPNCYMPPQEDVSIIYSSERSVGTEFEPDSSIPPSEKPVIQLVYEEKGKDRTPITETKGKMDLKKAAGKHERNCSNTTHPVTTTEEGVIEEEDSEADEENEGSINGIEEDTTSNNDNQPNFYHPLGCDNEEFYNSQEHQYSREKELDCYLPGSYNSETDWNQEFVPDFTNNTSHTLHCYEPPQEEVPIIYSSGSLAGTTSETVSSIPSSEDLDTQGGCENIRSCHVSNYYKPPQEEVPIIYSSESSCSTPLEPVSVISSSHEKEISEDPSIICAEMSSDSSQNEGIPSHKIGCRCKLYENQKCANSACKVTLLPGKNVVNPVTKEKVCLCSNTFCNLPLPPGKHVTHPLTQEKVLIAMFTIKDTGRTGDTVGAKIKQWDARQLEDSSDANSMTFVGIPIYDVSDSD
ncbi:hypothetical protein GCK72_021533 [Caenorhabditis remanei]|uniref:Uncharacterized protein n=1 Tax=Caenorhabditis remanei TaxID=31234 RepID=A0A6A5GIF1_CAERE|nr:hypothetical protein GCK72_021533 [Caenorhabditis remanei]KAF1754967.1 hypothetical protein GCK72_021533 [Caenorhabditis remanei]